MLQILGLKLGDTPEFYYLSQTLKRDGSFSENTLQYSSLRDIAFGETYLTRRLLQHAEDMFDHPFEKIVYSYGEFQPLFIESEK